MIARGALRPSACAAITCAFVLGHAPEHVQAHPGATPASTNLALPPDGDSTIVLPATFGIVLSKDGGETFHWICDAAVGLDAGSFYDPDHAIAADGTIFVTSAGSRDPYPAEAGLRISRDGGCTFTAAAGFGEDTWVDRVEIGPNGWVWAATAEGAFPNDVYVSKDNGESFALAGLHLDTGSWFKSIKIAPGDPQRVYVSGYRSGTDKSALLYRTVDGGESWESLSISEFTFTSTPQLFLLGVSPTDPDVVFARVANVENPDDGLPSQDVVYRSNDDDGDGTLTWTQVLALPEPADIDPDPNNRDYSIKAFVIRQDGTTVIAGTVDGGVRISHDGGLTWEVPTQQPKMACLGEATDGTLYACGDNWAPDLFALATSTDGQTWDGILRFNEIVGPLECDPGTIQHDVCAALKWDVECKTFSDCAVVDDAGPGADAGAGVDAGPGGDGDSCGGCNAGGLTAFIFLWPLVLRRRQKTIA